MCRNLESGGAHLAVEGEPGLFRSLCEEMHDFTLIKGSEARRTRGLDDPGPVRPVVVRMAPPVGQSLHHLSKTSA